VGSFGYLHVFLRFDILIEHNCNGKIHNEEPAKHLGQHEHKTGDNNRAQSVADWCQLFPELCQMFPEWCQMFPEGCQTFPEGCQTFTTRNVLPHNLYTHTVLKEDKSFVVIQTRESS
jgi:hypothetical protein